MRALVWIIGGVLVVDLTIVAWFAISEVLDRRRVRREIAFDAPWRARAASQLRLVHSSAAVAMPPPRTEHALAMTDPPMLAMRPRASRASLGALVAALVALLVVLGLDMGVPLIDRAATDGRDAGVASTLGPDPGADRSTTGSPSDDPTSSTATAGAALPVREVDGDDAEAPGGAPAPDQVAADPRSPDEIVLAWVAVPDAVAYVIERWDDPPDASPDWTRIGRTGADATTYVDTGLEPATTYYYRVSAVTEEGPAPSDVVSATTQPGPPAAPVLLASTNGNSVELQWDDVDGETGYSIERAADPGGEWTPIGTVGQDVVRYVDGGLETAAAYSYRVIATNETGGSAPSNVVTVTVGGSDGASSDGGSQSVEPDAGAADGAEASQGSATSDPPATG